MTPQPPPCQHCGRARLQTGLCPHCEHVYCTTCNEYMPLIEMAEHFWVWHLIPVNSVPFRPYLFWWEITKDLPDRCPDCGSILNAEGRCTELVRFGAGHALLRASDDRLRPDGPNWPPRRF